MLKDRVLMLLLLLLISDSFKDIFFIGGIKSNGFCLLGIFHPGGSAINKEILFSFYSGFLVTVEGKYRKLQWTEKGSLKKKQFAVLSPKKVLFRDQDE